MSKVLTFIMLSAGILAVFALFGIGGTGTTTSQVLQAVGFNQNLSTVENTNMFTMLFSTTSGKIFTFGTAGTIIAGFFSSTAAIQVITATVVATFATWIVGDLYIVYTTMKDNLGGEFSFISSILLVFIAVYIIGAIVALVSYWQGSDG